jgi:hypothetical protein
MSEELEPRHYSDRELTLSAISLTFQRARSVQGELTGTPSWSPSEPVPAPDPATGPAPTDDHGARSTDRSPRTRGAPAPTERSENADSDRADPDRADSDREFGNGDSGNVDSDIEDGPGTAPGSAGDDELWDRLQLYDSVEPDLPNPIVTDANLRYYLNQATAHQGRNRHLLGLGPILRRITGLAQTLGRPDQVRYNTVMVQALHQLDHRTRLQQRSITRLEAELADSRRALDALESNELRAP